MPRIRRQMGAFLLKEAVLLLLFATRFQGLQSVRLLVPRPSLIHLVEILYLHSFLHQQHYLYPHSNQILDSDKYCQVLLLDWYHLIIYRLLQMRLLIL
jgi:hypothetical protein